MLSAKTISAASTSGLWLKNELFPRLGVADKVNLTLTPRGTGAAAMVAAGEAGLAVMPVSEIVVAPGVDFAGAIPAEIQMIQTFSAAMVAGSKEVEASRRLIQFLASPGAAEAIKKSGMEPVVASR